MGWFPPTLTVRPKRSFMTLTPGLQLVVGAVAFSALAALDVICLGAFNLGQLGGVDAFFDERISLTLHLLTTTKRINSLISPTG
jgi:hypothetical protein